MSKRNEVVLSYRQSGVVLMRLGIDATPWHAVMQRQVTGVSACPQEHYDLENVSQVYHIFVVEEREREGLI